MDQAKLKSELHYDPLTGIFIRLRARRRMDVGSVAGYKNNNGYVIIRIFGREYLAHRLAWLYVYGEWPLFDTDHINRNRADNSISNLRDVTHSENCRNIGGRKNNTSGVSGVSYSKIHKLWFARSRHQGKLHHHGYYRDWFDAVCARMSWLARNPINPPSQTGPFSLTVTV